MRCLYAQSSAEICGLYWWRKARICVKDLSKTTLFDLTIITIPHTNTREQTWDWQMKASGLPTELREQSSTIQNGAIILTFSCSGTSPMRYDLRFSSQATPIVQPLIRPFSHILVCPCSSNAGNTTCSSSSSKDNSLTGASLKPENMVDVRLMLYDLWPVTKVKYGDMQMLTRLDTLTAN